MNNTKKKSINLIKFLLKFKLINNILTDFKIFILDTKIKISTNSTKIPKYIFNLLETKKQSFKNPTHCFFVSSKTQLDATVKTISIEPQTTLYTIHMQKTVILNDFSKIHYFNSPSILLLSNLHIYFHLIYFKLFNK